MANKIPRIPAEFIMSLNMNGLQGRMLSVPAPKGKTREILYVYGHHSSLERWWGLIQELNKYGAVTMPDLPGFGGMDSFYKIGQKPTIDNLADYLSSFVKLRYRSKRLTIVGLSFGFVIVTRMLQRYPELVKKVDLLVSVVGFAHKDDFTFTKPRYLFYRYTAAFFAHRFPAVFFRNVILAAPLIRAVYGRTYNARHKFANTTLAGSKALMDFEVHLWHCNDVRTYMATTVEFLTLDNCKQTVGLPVWHVAVKVDGYFDNHVIEQHMRVIFTGFHKSQARINTHAPTVIATAKEIAPFIPNKIRKLLDSD